MNAEELKARALALTHTAIAMRARAEDPTCEVAWRRNKKWFIEKPLWTDGTDYCLAELQQGRVDWTRPVWLNGRPVEIIWYNHAINMVLYVNADGLIDHRLIDDSKLTNDPPKPETTLDLTKPIRQRCGRAVRNVEESGGPAYPIMADCERHDGFWEKRAFFGNGVYCSQRSDWDLVNYEPQYRDLNADEMAELVGTAVWADKILQSVEAFDASTGNVHLFIEQWTEAEWLHENATYDREGLRPVAKEVSP